MSFFKSLLLAILATLFLTYVLGISILDLFDVDVYMGDELIEPLKAISFAALVAVVLVIVAMAIVLTVFGSILFVGLLVVGALGLAAIGVFWPVLVVAFILWLVLREPKKAPVN
ncbi:hypothetical protein [Thalassotalea euphylliae]|uniref:Uncharacterized protein n=1 Tax=Thalassotalea euphylliae TaxID=1655234 RepID=A0A3E0UCF1_9GAMM|nr:hypothetical protein [Thalassotalea euphylliae]REL34257.1 hypothetical protein DXX92_02225 [Thalassotalea euphylliae]